MLLTTHPRAWLTHFPPTRRGPISNWFHNAVRGGASTPATVLLAVRETCAQQRRWRQDHPDAALVQDAIVHDEAGALAYATSVIDYEQLSYDQREALKEERAAYFRLEAMRRKPPTEAQLEYLATLGDYDDPPANMAEASQRIDQLRQERGWV